MTNLENLNEENGDMSLENLTDEQARIVAFSPEFTGTQEERNEYFRNIIKDMDMNKLKGFIEETDIDISSLKNTLTDDYGFTETEVKEAGEYLDKLKANPDILESDIENSEMFPPIIPIILAILKALGLISGGIGIGYLIRGRNKTHENVYISSGRWELPKEVLKIVTAEQEFHDVAGYAKMSSDLELFGYTIKEDFREKEVYVKLDGKLSASFDGNDFLKNFKGSITSDGEGNLKIDIELKRPNLTISDVNVHDVRTDDNFWNKLFKDRNLDRAHEDAYNKAIQSIIEGKQTSNEFYEFARQSLEQQIKNLYEMALEMSGKTYKSIDVNVKYTNDIGHIYYNRENGRRYGRR